MSWMNVGEVYYLVSKRYGRAQATDFLDRLPSLPIRLVLYERGDRSEIRPDLVNTAEDILARPDKAETPHAMNLPGYRLHSLKGELKGFWSVTVRANWRIIFRFGEADAFDVELIDYH